MLPGVYISTCSDAGCYTMGNFTNDNFVKIRRQLSSLNPKRK